MTSTCESVAGPAKRSTPLRPLTPAEQQVVLDNLGLAGKEAWRIAYAVAAKSCRVPGAQKVYAEQIFEDLIDAGWLGLCIGAQRFEAERGFAFSTFACPWIRQQIGAASQVCELRAGKWARDKCKPWQRPRMKMFGEMGFGSKGGNRSFYGDDRGVMGMDVLDRTDYEEPRQQLSTELTVLLGLALENDRWARLVRQYVLEERTLLEIGEDEGISKERVRQIVAKALVVLRECRGFMQALEAQVYRATREVQARDLFQTAELIA